MIDCVLVGRTEHLARLAEALAADTPAAVIGEAGVGKTALLRAAAAASNRQVFEGGALATLSWLDYLALERALGRPIPRGDPTDVAVRAESVVGAGVLVLDDLQWAAPGTIETAELLAGRIGLLAGVRRGDPGADVAIDRLCGAGFVPIELRGLEDDDARALLRERQPGLGPAAAARLIARTGGNPLLLHELAATGEASQSLRLALGARLRRLDEVGREAFGVLALAGRPVSIEALGTAGAKSLLAADLATATGDEGIEIRHALLGEVAIDDMSEDERRRLHAIVARNVEDHGEAAGHYAMAGERSNAFAAAMRAADAADRPGVRARHLAIAASCSDGADAQALRLKAGLALEDAHEWAALTAVLEPLREAAPAVRANAELIRARAAWRAGDPDGLRTSIEEGLRLVGGTGSDVEIQLRIEQGRVPIFLDGDADEALRMTASALEQSRAAGVDVPRAMYMHGTACYLAADREGASSYLGQAVASARDAGDVSTEMVAANNLIAMNESLGDPALAREYAGTFVERAHELGLGVWERSFRIASSNLEFHAGNYPAVLAAADELLDLPLEQRSREALLEQLCLALIDTGRIDEAERRIAAIAGRPDDWTSNRQVMWVLAQAALWGGRAQRALQLADEILTGPETDLNIAFAAATRAWALFDLDRDPGPPPTVEHPGMLRAIPEEVAGIGRLHARQHGDAVERLDRAAALWQSYHRRGELRCRWAAGEAARRGGAADATERLLAVETQATELGMLPLLGRVHRSLRAAGVRRSAPRERAGTALLTGRERTVLEFVAAGLTNAEIAGRLSVSRHTVVSQIASASAKLGASGRTHAATLANRAGSA